MKFLIAIAALLFSLSSASAEDVLFLGNSFTSGNNLASMVAAIAESKGKSVAAIAVTKGGQDFAYHLKHSLAKPEATAKSWDFVVLQDHSLGATHARKFDDFLKNGEQLVDRVAEKSPSAQFVLYETWSYAADHKDLKEQQEGPAKFKSPEQMFGEIQKNYATLQAQLRAKDSKRTVLIAPVGAAFARCVREHPEIELYSQDRKHPSIAGTYLAALVIYATIFNDSPLDAAPGRKVDPKQVNILQQVADETVKAARSK